MLTIGLVGNALCSFSSPAIWNKNRSICDEFIFHVYCLYSIAADCASNFLLCCILNEVKQKRVAAPLLPSSAVGLWRCKWWQCSCHISINACTCLESLYCLFLHCFPLTSESNTWITNDCTFRCGNVEFLECELPCLVFPVWESEHSVHFALLLSPTRVPYVSRQEPSKQIKEPFLFFHCFYSSIGRIRKRGEEVRCVWEGGK